MKHLRLLYLLFILLLVLGCEKNADKSVENSLPLEGTVWKEMTIDYSNTIYNFYSYGSDGSYCERHYRWVDADNCCVFVYENNGYYERDYSKKYLSYVLTYTSIDVKQEIYLVPSAASGFYELWFGNYGTGDKAWVKHNVERVESFPPAGPINTDGSPYFGDI